MLGPPPRLPDPDMSWDELVEEAAASEYLAKERQSRGEAANDDGLSVLPRVRLAPASARAMMIGGGPAGQERPARLLLVDDDSNLLVVLSEQLRDDGFDVATARDGVEAMRRLEARQARPRPPRPDDAGLDGLSLAHEIKAGADLPIIVLSAVDAPTKGAAPRRGRRGLRRQALSLPRAAGAGPTGPPAARRPDARPALVVGPAWSWTSTAARAVAARPVVGLTPIESRPSRPGRRPGRRSSPSRRSSPAVGRTRGGGRVLRVGLHAPAAPQARSRPEPPPSTSSPFAASAIAWRWSRRGGRRLRVRILITVTCRRPPAPGHLRPPAGRQRQHRGHDPRPDGVVAASAAGVGGPARRFVVRPLRALETRLDRSRPDGPRGPVGIHLADDELGRLADSRRIAADLARRNREVGGRSRGHGVVAADGSEGRSLGRHRARAALGLIDCPYRPRRPRLGADRGDVPGDPRPVGA